MDHVQRRSTLCNPAFPRQREMGLRAPHDSLLVMHIHMNWRRCGSSSHSLASLWFGKEGASKPSRVPIFIPRLPLTITYGYPRAKPTRHNGWTAQSINWPWQSTAYLDRTYGRLTRPGGALVPGCRASPRPLAEGRRYRIGSLSSGPATLVNLGISASAASCGGLLATMDLKIKEAASLIHGCRK